MPRAASQLSLFKGRRQRGVRAPSAKEFSLHVMVADTLRRWASPSWRWTHFPSGENRSAITGARLKRMGVQRGWPDFLLLAPDETGLHFLELKRRGQKLTADQTDLHLWCVLHGYPFATVDNYEMALTVLRQWGAVRTSVRVSA
jgi:hypothetical protein